MSFLIDTCVISEFVKRKPDENVRNWYNDQKEGQAFEDDGLRYRSSILRYEKDLNLMAMTQEHRSEEFFTITLSSYYICLFLRFLIGVNVSVLMDE